MDNFEVFYDEMTNRASRLESIIAELYSKEGNSNLVMGLAEELKALVEMQRDFTNAYCQDSIKDALVSNLDSKINSLSEEINQGRTL